VVHGYNSGYSTEVKGFPVGEHSGQHNETVSKKKTK
jgi:hypothetical protein